ncbi:hypothetical protein PLICRDRAFT_444188 [Plicaturopsis crispa FD-325 SS-3]|uniref:Uncharacterized protein n=1 Tax=Plicaturopsis crispa FD-325 SS-3 TaxID=944288 RepID=A0A0C9SQK0_PLICR|nr:hypothetical protein PLICRDRAFT_444188 [Plicaturopsis crispa FD-325 SS-3]
MSSKAYDSELYDDLYGDGENTEYAVPLQDPEDDGDRDDKEKQYGSSSDATSPGPDSSSVPQSANKAAGHSLPAKPPSPGAAALSYSAQIARQFSAYQQTPSQERQQRAAIPLPPNPRGVAAAPAPIPSVISTHEAPGGRQNVDRPIRPSEMKDEG